MCAPCSSASSRWLFGASLGPGLVGIGGNLSRMSAAAIVTKGKSTLTGRIGSHLPVIWTDPRPRGFRIGDMSRRDLRAPEPGPRPQQGRNEDLDWLVRHVARGDEAAFEAVYDQ